MGRRIFFILSQGRASNSKKQCIYRKQRKNCFASQTLYMIIATGYIPFATTLFQINKARKMKANQPLLISSVSLIWQARSIRFNLLLFHAKNPKKYMRRMPSPAFSLVVAVKHQQNGAAEYAAFLIVPEFRIPATPFCN